MNSGVYQIRNLVNGKIYVGSTKDFDERKENHFKELKARYHCNQYLQNSYNKHGEHKFIFEVKEYCSEDKLIEREQWWIDNTPCMYYQRGYNILPIAGSSLGYKHSEETKQKMSKSKKDIIPWNKGKKEVQISSNKGRKLSEEIKEKIRLTLKDRKLSEETKRRISEATKGTNNPMYGRNHTEEAKRKMSKAKEGKKFSEKTREMLSLQRKGKKHTEETKKKISESHKGVKKTQEHKNKLREINLGKHLTEETKKKISESIKGENHPRSKLTWCEVKEIREKYLPHKYTLNMLAKEYDMPKSTIGKIVYNKTWKIE